MAVSGKIEAYTEPADNVKKFKSMTVRDVVGGDDAATTSRDTNVAGLSSSITLANELRTDIISHFANTTRHTAAAHPTTTIGAVATDLTSLLSLTGTMLTLYAAHNTDAVKASGWEYHDAQTTAKALSSAAAPTTLEEAITRLNDLKAKYNDHEDETTGHGGSSVTADQVAASNAAFGAAILVPVTGAQTGDYVVWSILDSGSGSVTGVSAVAGSGGVTFTFSADPQDDAIISYVVLRGGDN